MHEVFGETNCINPLDSRQYLFCLTPKPGTVSYSKLSKNVTSIGKLDIVWRTGMGERGRLQTSQLERMVICLFIEPYIFYKLFFSIYNLHI